MSNQGPRSHPKICFLGNILSTNYDMSGFLGNNSEMKISIWDISYEVFLRLLKDKITTNTILQILVGFNGILELAGSVD